MQAAAGAQAPPALYAHRLGGAYGPDSSRAALAHTLTQPVDGLETDCCLTADEQLVLLHDPLLEIGTTLRGWAHERKAAELLKARLRNRDGTPSDERPLLLDELLELAPADMTLELEIKAHADADLARRTAAAVCRRLRDDPARERAELMSFWAGACALAAGEGLRARLLLVADYCLRELAAWAHSAGVSGVGVAHGLLSRELMQTLREAGLGVSTFTVNDAVTLRAIAPLGPDAVTSDAPHELRAALGRAGRTPAI
jgi:glycerophosphoryl diester phosphodiesterase